MSMRGPYHQQKPDSLREIISEYDSELAELTFNSKPIINNLTIVAGENIHASEQIAKLIEHRLTSAHMKRKLPFLYLTDSIVKNIGGVYHQLFSSNIDMLFLNVYEKADEPTRQSLHRLLSTWPPIFPEKVPLIEERIKLMPLSPTAEEASAPSTAPKIHVNPRYLARRQEVERGHGPGRLDEMLASSEWEQQQMRRRVSPPSRSGRPSWRDQQRGYHARSDGSHGVSRGAVGHSAFPPGSPSFNVGGGEASFLQPQNTQLASLLGTIPQDLIVQETQTLILRLEQQIRDQLQGGTLSPNEQLELLKQLQQLKTLQQQALQLQTTTSSAYPATPAFGTTPLPLQLQLPATTFHPRQYPDITQLAASLMGSSALPSTTAATPTTTTPAAAAAAASSPATSLSPFASLDTSNLLHSLTTLGIISPFGGGPPQSTSIPTQPIPTALPLSLPTALPATPHSLPQPTAAIPPARHHAAPPPIHQQPPIKRPRLDSGSTSTAAESSRGRPGLNKLYSPSASQCATCGLRFTDKEKMGKHLDWHFAMNCKEKEKIKKPLSRTWYLTAEDWTMNVEVADKSGMASSSLMYYKAALLFEGVGASVNVVLVSFSFSFSLFLPSIVFRLSSDTILWG
ncbi:mRNA 3' end processing factor, variant 3 [Balamuthia mandrillaris]